MGAALNLFSYFTFEESDELIIEGCPEEFRNEDNLVVKAYQYALEKLNLDYRPFKLSIATDVPVSRGLGSSSTCVIAGVYAAMIMNWKHPDKQTIVNICTELEGHPDNVAPAVMGGLVSGFNENGVIHTLSFPVSPLWRFVTIVPDYHVLTHEARKIIKKDIHLNDAVYTTGHALAMIKAFETADEHLLSGACHDLLHEPYRKDMIRDYEPLRKLALDAGACGYYISGSGSAMIAMTTSEDVMQNIKKSVKIHYPDFQVMDLKVCNEGSRAE